MIKVGDTVKIANDGDIYTTIFSFLEGAQQTLVVPTEVLSKYVYGRSPDEEDMTKEYKVYFVGSHPSSCFSDRTLALISDGEKTFVIDVNGLKTVSKLSVGDKVIVVDVGKHYDSYDNFMHRHKNELKESVYWGWKFGRIYGATYHEDVPVFTVKLIAPHTDDKSKELAVIYDGKDTFIFDVEGLKRVRIVEVED